jgi:hypothetical protein
MELSLGAAAVWLAALAPERVNGSLYHGITLQKDWQKFPRPVFKAHQGLSEAAQAVAAWMYLHFVYSIAYRLSNVKTFFKGGVLIRHY